jgi:hypothetical protein
MNYEITLVNKSAAVVAVREADGTEVARLMSGEQMTLECDDPLRALAAYSRITFLPKEPFADCVPRPGFQPPAMRWPVVFVNTGQGRSPHITTRWVNGAQRYFMRGVSVTLDVDPREDWAVFERVELNVLVDRMEKSPHHIGYMQRVLELKDRGSERSLAALAELEKYLDSLNPPAAAEPEENKNVE